MLLYTRILSEIPRLKRIILLHGLGGTGILWRPIARQFSPEYELIALDQRGHGHSPVSDSDDFTPLTLSQDVIDTVIENQWQKPVLIGHSMGARTALGAIFLRPELFSGLIYIDLPLGRTTQEFQPLAHFLKQMADTYPSLEEARKWLKANAPDQSIAQYLSAVLMTKPDGSIGFPFKKNGLLQITEQAINATPAEWMQSITKLHRIPILIFRGKQSMLWTDTLFQRDLVKIKDLPHTEIIEVNQATHGLPFEQKEIFVTATELFIKEKNLFYPP